MVNIKVERKEIEEKLKPFFYGNKNKRVSWKAVAYQIIETQIKNEKEKRERERNPYGKAIYSQEGFSIYPSNIGKFHVCYKNQTIIFLEKKTEEEAIRELKEYLANTYYIEDNKIYGKILSKYEDKPRFHNIKFSERLSEKELEKEINNLKNRS